MEDLWLGTGGIIRKLCIGVEENTLEGMIKKDCAAVILAAGQGKRMQSGIPKQYLMLEDKPVIYYALKAFQDSFVNRIVLVVSEEDIEYCKKNVVEKYGFGKVAAVVAGGKERYHSVYEGLKAAECDYVFIHDGARPFVTEEIIERGYACAVKYDACVVGMPTKDTVKIADADNFAASTPGRDKVWLVQTPQIFSYDLIFQAYSALIDKEQELLQKSVRITDDAMVVETFTDRKVKLVEGSYENIKITTPGDLEIARALKNSIKNYS